VESWGTGTRGPVGRVGGSTQVRGSFSARSTADPARFHAKVDEFVPRAHAVNLRRFLDGFWPHCNRSHFNAEMFSAGPRFIASNPRLGGRRAWCIGWQRRTPKGKVEPHKTLTPLPVSRTLSPPAPYRIPRPSYCPQWADPLQESRDAFRSASGSREASSEGCGFTAKRVPGAPRYLLREPRRRLTRVCPLPSEEREPLEKF